MVETLPWLHGLQCHRAPGSQGRGGLFERSWTSLGRRWKGGTSTEAAPGCWAPPRGTGPPTSCH